MQVIDVETSQYAIGSVPEVLATSGIGSCVAICLYEKQRKIGALLHIMLPRAEDQTLNPLRFADTALSIVLVELGKQSVFKEQLTAKLVGGAQMFKAVDLTNNIGERNIREVRLLLSALGIMVEAEDLGGSSGRSLEFVLETGAVHISTKALKPK
jgi:chemotaxis protein CheD